MSFEIMHFRGSDTILKQKKMEKEVRLTLEYLDDCLVGTMHRSEIMRQALVELDWRMNGDLNILEGRRYFYKGFKKGIAIEGNFSSYEFIQDGLLRLQIGYDKGKVEMGILLLTAQRSEKSPYGSTRQLVEKEIEYLYPTISLPVAVVLFDLGLPYGLRQEEKSAIIVATDGFEDDAGNNQAMAGETDFQDHPVNENESGIAEEGAVTTNRKKKQSRRKKKVAADEYDNPGTDERRVSP